MRLPLQVCVASRLLHWCLVGFVLSGLVLKGASKSAEEVSKATLGNGLRVVIVPSPLAPVVTTVVNYLVGSNEAPGGFPGMAHAVEHMMFRGSADLSGDQLAKIAAAMGGEYNAETHQSITQYAFTVPKQDLDVVLNIESRRMRSLLSEDDLWEHERGAMEQEVAGDLSDSEYILNARLLSVMFRGTPYEHDPLGTRPSFEATTAAMLKKFHDSWYAPNNAILVIAGDVDPVATMAAVKGLFGPISSKGLPLRPHVPLQPMKPRTLHIAAELPYGLAVDAFRWPGSTSSDFPTAQLLADVLDSQRGGLNDLVIRGKALTARFQLDSLPQASIGYALATFPDGEDGAAVLRQIRQKLEDCANSGISANLFKAAKRHEIVDQEFQKNSVSDLAMLWSRAIAVDERSSPNEEIEEIQKVTLDDVRSMARHLLNPKESVSAILTARPPTKPVSSAPLGRAESFAAREDVHSSVPDWAQKVTHLSIPASNVHPEVTQLSNGLKLIVQPERAGDTVTVVGHIENAFELKGFNGKEGVDQVLDELLCHGTRSLNRVAFQKALDDIGADESPGSDFSLNVLAGSFERGVALLAENELHPALPASAFKIIRSQIAGSVAGEMETPAYRAKYALESALLPKNDPGLRQATFESISSLSLADVREYYRRVFRPDSTTIVVIGNVTPVRARSVIENCFGKWKAHGPRVNTVLPPVPINQPSNTEVPNASRVQAEVTLAETLPVTRFSPDYYALNLGINVLDGGFYASRLSRDLREDTGLVYSVSSRLEATTTRARYVINLGCDPRNIARARNIVVRDLKQLQTDVVSEEVLSQAKAFLLQQIPLSESSIPDIADGLISRATNGLPLNEPSEAARIYIKLTPRQVQDAFARWIRPQDLVEITEGPGRTPK